MNHSELVAALKKPDVSFEGNVGSLVHMIMGLSGEVGELMESVKKHAVYGKELDYLAAVEELGDIEFYLEGLRQDLGIEREQTIEYNIKKLLTRYHSGTYSDEAALSRVDKTKDGVV